MDAITQISHCKGVKRKSGVTVFASVVIGSAKSLPAPEIHHCLMHGESSATLARFRTARCELNRIHRLPLLAGLRPKAGLGSAPRDPRLRRPPALSLV